MFHSPHSTCLGWGFYPHPTLSRPPRILGYNRVKPLENRSRGSKNRSRIQHRFYIDFASIFDPKMKQKSTKKRTKLNTKTIPRSNIIFSSKFDEICTIQTLKNSKKPKEHIGFSMICLFPIDIVSDQKNVPKWAQKLTKNQSNGDKKHDQKIYRIFIRKIGPKWLQNAPQNRQNITLGTTLGPEMDQKCSKNASDAKF